MVHKVIITILITFWFILPELMFRFEVPLNIVNYYEMVLKYGFLLVIFSIVPSLVYVIFNYTGTRYQPKANLSFAMRFKEARKNHIPLTSMYIAFFPIHEYRSGSLPWIILLYCSYVISLFLIVLCGLITYNIIILSLFSGQYLEDFASIAVIFSGLLFFTLTAALYDKYPQMWDK